MIEGRLVGCTASWRRRVVSVIAQRLLGLAAQRVQVLLSDVEATYMQHSTSGPYATQPSPGARDCASISIRSVQLLPVGTLPSLDQGRQ
jgi:hypothetical protein